MRNHLTLGALCVAMLAAGCQSVPTAPNPNEAPPPKNAGFGAEMDKFNKQFPNAKNTAYETQTLAYNNAQKLNEKGNCHVKSIHPVTIILTLDATGRVTDSITDVENAKAQCFRKNYAGVKFAPPPVAPYRKPIMLN
jgi:hypothetical protein